jgi:hypothetical protein
MPIIVFNFCQRFFTQVSVRLNLVKALIFLDSTIIPSVPRVNKC